MGRVYAILTAVLLLHGTCCEEADTLETTNACGKNENNNGGVHPDLDLPDYLIIGAGGSGIQTALLLDKYGYSYNVLEAKDNIGSFWASFPRFRELISVNKWVRNETQRLRFDWHSMLEAPVQMGDVTEDYFPQGSDYQLYMKRVAEEANLKVEFGVDVASLATDNTPCVTLVDGSQRCAKHRVFVGTGLREKPEPYLRALGGIPYSNMTREMAYHRRVCILGNGNSAFEVAQNVVGVADRVVLYGRHPHRFSAVTRYTGDVRIKFAQALENFHGKLLDTVDHFTKRPVLNALERRLLPNQVENVRDMLEAASYVHQFDCETLVLATGFRSHVPGIELKGRFPPTKDWYAWGKNPKIHFVGWLMHEADFRKGSGGFFSGFRYLIRNLVHHIRTEDYGVAYPYRVLNKEEVVEHALARIQTADDLVIMQDAVTLMDIVVKAPAQTEDNPLYHYYEGITHKFHGDLASQEEVMSLYFAWGDGRRSSRAFESVYRFNDTGDLMNIFLHPVVQANGLVRNVLEDTDMEWSSPMFVSACVKTIRAAMDQDLAEFRPRKRFPYKRDVVNHGDGARDYETAGTDPSFSLDLVKAITAAGESGGTPQDFEDLRAVAVETMPEVFAALSIA